MRKRLLFAGLTFVLCTAVVFVVGEGLVRWLAPVKALYPRYRHSPEFGLALFPSTRMVHTVPGSFRLEYSVNPDGFRGASLDVRHAGQNVLCLGDSYTFGMGVPDGCEYPSVLSEILGSEYQVINRGAPGWGLTQQIRLYCEEDALLQPDFVTLQFCANDPTDNLNNLVTRLHDGQFVFQNSPNTANELKRYLSRSWIQRSQLYNFLRQRAYLLWKRHHLDEMQGEFTETNEGSQSPSSSPAEQLYVDLLEHFARRVEADGRSLIFFAVEGQLARFPSIRSTIDDLEKQGRLTYLETSTLFETLPDIRSPEGHWGEAAHVLLARALADTIRRGARE